MGTNELNSKIEVPKLEEKGGWGGGGGVKSAFKLKFFLMFR